MSKIKMTEVIFDEKSHKHFLTESDNPLEVSKKFDDFVKFRFYNIVGGNPKSTDDFSMWYYNGKRLSLDAVKDLVLSSKSYDLLLLYMENNNVSSVCDTGFGYYPMESDSLTLEEYLEKLEEEKNRVVSLDEIFKDSDGRRR